ncbi:hypothetical protein HDV63DRAFT_72811 [Trichoderma sp. SZMC 28014]
MQAVYSRSRLPLFKLCVLLCIASDGSHSQLQHVPRTADARSHLVADPASYHALSGSPMYPDRCFRGPLYRYLCHTSRPPSLGVPIRRPVSFPTGRFLFTSLFSSLFRSSTSSEFLLPHHHLR